MRMRRRLSPAALQRLGSDPIPTQAAHLTYTPEGVKTILVVYTDIDQAGVTRFEDGRICAYI